MTTFWRPKISNRRFSVRVSPNPKNLIFELENFFGPKSSALNLANFFFFDLRPKKGRKKYFSDLRFFFYTILAVFLTRPEKACPKEWPLSRNYDFCKKSEGQFRGSRTKNAQ